MVFIAGMIVGALTALICVGVYFAVEDENNGE